MRVTLRSEKWQVHGPLAIMWKSKSIFFSTASCALLFSRSFEPLFVCDPGLGMVENVCYILSTARFWPKVAMLDDHGFMVAKYSFVAMSSQAWIDFIRCMFVIDWGLFHSPR